MSKPLPQAKESEAGLISACLIRPDFIDEAHDRGLDRNSFTSWFNGAIWEAARSLHHDGQGIDEITMIERLDALGHAEKITTTDVVKLFDNFEAPTNAQNYLQTVLDKWRLRQVINLCKKAIERAHDPLCDPSDVISELNAEIGQMECGKDDRRMVEIVGDVDKELFEDNLDDYIPSGIPSYDSSMKGGGFGPRQLAVVAGRPGRGKSTFGFNVVARAAVHNSTPVGIISMEMGDSEIAEILCTMVSGVSANAIRDKVASAEQKEKYRAAMQQVGELPIYIDDRTNKIEKIASKVRMWVRRFGVKIVVIDYIQLIRHGNAKYKREEQISSISRDLKLIAKENNIPILALAQLNRESEREDREPRLADLRESGAIEQDADSVTFLYNLKKDEYDEGPEILRWCRPKQRSGVHYASGKFRFKKSLARIGDI